MWILVPKPENTSIIGTKWIFRNKINESGEVVRNKSLLIAQGYLQHKRSDDDETFAHMTRLELI